MIEMQIQGVTTDRNTQLQIAWLEGVRGNVMFPVVVGSLEAVSISSTLYRQPLKRPNAHDLVEAVLDHFEARVDRVEITEISQGLLRANVVLETEGGPHEMGARASDAVALAVKYQAPIFLSERVLARVGYVINKTEEGKLLYARSLPPPGQEPEEDPAEETGGIAEDADRLLRLQARLTDAVKEERYEDAADIRDEIDRVRGGDDAQT